MKRLLLAGMILFLLGLLTGAGIPFFTNTRMGLAAHMAGVQNGLVLLVFGLVWKHVQFSPSQETWCKQLSIFSMYALWFAQVLAATWGTSSATPMAGAGYSGAEWQEMVVNLFLYSGSFAIIISVVLYWSITCLCFILII